MAETLTVEQMATDVNTKIEGIKSEIEAKAKKDDVDSLKEKNESLEQKLNDLTAEIVAVKDAAALKETKEKGQLVEYLESDERKKRVKNKNAGFNTLEIKVPANMTTANVLPNVANGFNQLFNNYIDTTVYETPKREIFILDLVTVETQPGTEVIWYVERVNEDSNATFIGEGDVKQLIDADWQERRAEVREIASRWKMSDRMRMHTNSVVQDFRKHADELFNVNLDTGVLSGDGAGNNLSGVITEASSFTAPTQLANFYSDANIWDVIHAVAVSIKLANFRGERVVVLNTVWEAIMKGYKGSDGHYIVPPFASPDGTMISGMRMVFNNGVANTHILCGVLRNYKVIFSEQMMFAEGFSEDDFDRNLMSFKLEAFLGSYLPQSLDGSIIYDAIATIITAIEAP